jgi:hypothetical protein
MTKDFELPKKLGRPPLNRTISEMERVSQIDVNQGEEKQVRNELDRVAERQPRARIPFGVPRSKLAVLGEIPGYCLKWIDDIGGRIEEAQAGGYEFTSKREIHLAPGAEVVPLSSDLGDRLSMIVGTNRQTGTAKRSYLMKIRNEFRDEDKKYFTDLREKRMNSIKRGQVSPIDRNFYFPNGNPINISKQE